MEDKQKYIKRNDVISIILIIFLIILYHLQYIYQMMPLQEGWHQDMGNNILNGLLPYKDFHCILPPVFPYICAGITHLFGDAPIVLRFYGVAERLIMFPIIFLILRRISPVQYAFIATMTGFFFYANVPADFICTFYQTTVLFGLLSFFCLIKYNELIKAEKINNLLVYSTTFLSGIFASLSLLTKQSSGLFIFVAIFIILVFIQILNKKFRYSDFLYFVLGSLIPCGVLFYYLKSNNIFDIFINVLFVDSLNCKGSNTSHLLFGFIERYFRSAIFYSGLIISGLLMYIFSIYKKYSEIYEKEKIKVENKIKYVLVFALLIVALITFSKLILLKPGHWSIAFLSFKHDFLCAFIFISIITAIIYYSYKFLKNKNLSYTEQIYIFISIFSFFILYAHGLSFQIESHGCFLILSALIVYYLQHTIPMNTLKNRVILLICFIFTGLCLLYRYNIPLEWWGYRDLPIRFAKYEINNDLTKGLKVSEKTADFYNEVLSLIDSVTDENDEIYTFPNLVSIYLLSGKKAKTFTTFPFWDTYPDRRARQDALYILQNPPKVIIMQEYNDYLWQFNENTFRNGMLSGQRDIVNAIYKLIFDETVEKKVKNKKIKVIKKSEYKLYKKYILPNALPIYVWYRK